MSDDTWFSRLTGFREDGYQQTKEKLAVEGDELVSRVNGRRFGIGRLELLSLRDLRARATPPSAPKRTVLGWAQGDVRQLHADPQFRGALFQVASQFNLLEMLGPYDTPEMGVTKYSKDRTQGPACAIAAGAATIYRNYFVPVGGHEGQTADRQIDALAGLGQRLAQHVGRPVADLWTMRNGYALATPDGLSSISRFLRSATEQELDELRGDLQIGLHWDVQVTDVEHERVHVSQAFCSAVPVAYSGLSSQAWEPLARLVLEATYEATLLAAAEQASRGRSRTVLLTRVGGSAFGNDAAWIADAMKRALGQVEQAGLDVRFVVYQAQDDATRRLLQWWESAGRQPALSR